MSYFHECSKCGASLDPGEKCDCMEEREQKAMQIANNLIVPKFGQISIKLEENFYAEKLQRT